jgi:KaiC/GvpD/RAD55 family RecA-like ATPase
MVYLYTLLFLCFVNSDSISQFKLILKKFVENDTYSYTIKQMKQNNASTSIYFTKFKKAALLEFSDKSMLMYDTLSLTVNMKEKFIKITKRKPSESSEFEKALQKLNDYSNTIQANEDENQIVYSFVSLNKQVSNSVVVDKKSKNIKQVSIDFNFNGKNTGKVEVSDIVYNLRRIPEKLKLSTYIVKSSTSWVTSKKFHSFKIIQ